MGFTDSKGFNGFISIMLGIMIIFLCVNIYYHNQITDTLLWFTPSLMLTINIILLLLTISFLIISLYRTFRSKGERASDLAKIQAQLPTSFKRIGNNKLKIEGRDRNMITVERLNNKLYRNIENCNDVYNCDGEFYECDDGNCSKKPLSDAFIRKNYPAWDNTTRI